VTQGPIPTLTALTLTPAEVAAGFTANPTGAGVDLDFGLAGALLDLRAAAQKLATVVAALPAGANSAAVAAQLALLLSAATSDIWDDALTWDDTAIWTD